MTSIISQAGKAATRISKKLASMPVNKRHIRLFWAFYNANIDNPRVSLKDARKAVRQ